MNKRLDEIGWGIFLIMIGTIWLVPSVPQGTWLVGTGILLVLLNAYRYVRNLAWSGVSTVLGVLVLAAGLSEMFGVTLPLFAIFLVVAGATMLLRPLVTQHA
jgi:hypothetical protein